tara:strand:- start:21455 stop:22126 length:672 start_codon:yes stop_codon:yes gene_type:complete
LKILAFDTSTNYCSISILIDGKTLSQNIHVEQRHSEFLLPGLHKLLAESELTLVQLDGIAFGAGPGSFTGLRIACGVAQGLAFGADLPVIGISTLEALAQQVGTGHVVTAIDARMGEIYHAAYAKSIDDWENVSAPVLCSPKYAPKIPENNWVGCGSGFDIYHDELRRHYRKSINNFEIGFIPNARDIAQLAEYRFPQGLWVNPIEATPIYIRNKIALKENER